MRTRRSLVLISLAIPLTLLQFDLSGCLPGTGGGGGGGGGVLFNVPPTVVLSADVVRGIAPLTVRFSSSGSTDDGLIVSRLWNFGDNQTSRDISPVHAFQSTGDYTVKLTLTDDLGASSTRSVIISVTEAPVAVINVDRDFAESAPAIFNLDASNSYDPDGEIQAYQWDFDDGSRELVPVVVHTFASPGTYRVRLTVTDDTGVTGSSDKIIQVGIPQPEIEFRVPPPDAVNIAVSPDSPLWVQAVYDVEPGVPRTIRAGLDGDNDPCEAQAVLYNKLSGEIIRRFTGHADRVSAVAYSPDGIFILTGSRDGTIRLYEAASGDLLRSPDGGISGAVTSLAFSPDGETYVYGVNDGSVALRNTISGSILRDFAGHPLGVNAVAFSPDGERVVSGSDDATAIVWDVASAEIVQTLDGSGEGDGHEFAVTSVAFSSNSSNSVLTGSVDQTAKLWRVQDGAVLYTYADEHTNAVTSVAFSPGDEFVLTGSDDTTARLWNTLSAGSAIRTFAGHSDRVAAVAFSPDGLQILTGSVDGSAILWDVASGDEVETFEPCISAIQALAFSADGMRVLLGVAARNDIQLDTNPPNGNDLNITIPVALDLSVLTDEQYPAQYYLWAELDTDRTNPARSYANTRVSVVRPFTASVDEFTPRIPLVDNEAMIVVAPTPNRQIFDLGPLREGDRLYLSLLTTPGYGEFYDREVFSVLVMDAQEKVFAWYQNSYILFTPDAKLIIGHDSPNYFVVVDGCRPPTCFDITFGSSVSVRVEPNVGLTPRPQRVYLDFEAGQSIKVADVGPLDFPAFDAVRLDGNWGAPETAIIKAAIVARLQELYGDYNVVFSTSDDGAPPAQPYQTIHFADEWGSWVTLFFYDLFGIADYIDPRNETLTGSTLVFTGTIAEAFPTLDASAIGLTIGNVAGHEAGHLFGLRHSEGGAQDLMDTVNVSDTDPGVRFMSSSLYRAEQYNGQIGIQDVPQLMAETVGLKP
ncbi:MAG: PKD domain-containing protein [Planctomycetota bacterium]